MAKAPGRSERSGIFLIGLFDMSPTRSRPDREPLAKRRRLPRVWIYQRPGACFQEATAVPLPRLPLRLLSEDLIGHAGLTARLPDVGDRHLPPDDRHRPPGRNRGSPRSRRLVVTPRPSYWPAVPRPRTTHAVSVGNPLHNLQTM